MECLDLGPDFPGGSTVGAVRTAGLLGFQLVSVQVDMMWDVGIFFSRNKGVILCECEEQSPKFRLPRSSRAKK